MDSACGGTAPLGDAPAILSVLYSNADILQYAVVYVLSRRNTGPQEQKDVQMTGSEEFLHCIGPGRGAWSHESTEESGGYCAWNGNQHGCHISFAQANLKACMPIGDIGCVDRSSPWIRIKVFGNGEYTTKTSAS